MAHDIHKCGNPIYKQMYFALKLYKKMEKKMGEGAQLLNSNEPSKKFKHIVSTFYIS